MRTSTKSTFLCLLMTSTSVFANPVPAQPSTLATEMYGLSVHQVMDVANEPPSKAASTTPAGAKSTGTGSSCSPEVQALAEGISANIADQRNEQAAVTAMGYILQESPLNASMFDAAKTSLMNFVSKGIAIRENNQKITPEGNAATAGLAKVAMAQQEEFNLTMSLSASNVAVSNATVEKLKANFAGGIVQNMKNLAAATKGCKFQSTAASVEAAPAKDGSGKAGSTETGSKDGSAEAASGKAGPDKAGSAKDGSGKAGSAETGSEAGAAEIASGKAAPAKEGAGSAEAASGKAEPAKAGSEAGAAEVASGKAAPAKEGAGSAETASGKAAPAKAGSAKDGSGKAGSAETGSEAGAAEVASGKAAPAKEGAGSAETGSEAGAAEVAFGKAAPAKEGAVSAEAVSGKAAPDI